MKENESIENNTPSAEGAENVCHFSYLNEMMGGQKDTIREIMEVFLTQVPEELHSLHEAIEKNDFAVIKSYAHTMKSSVSIMGISVLPPILEEMETLGLEFSDIERIKMLYIDLNSICQKAIIEIKNEMLTNK